jgi:hypothetical protein
MRLRTAVLLLAAFVLLAITLLVVAPWLRRERPNFVAQANAATAAVAGTVVDADGAALAGIEVTWFAAEGGGGLLGNRMFAGEGEHVVTDAEGRFHFANVPTSDGFAAIAGSRPRWEGETGQLTPRSGFVASEVRLVAEAIPATRRLNGKLRDERGAPVAFAEVTSTASSWLRNWQSHTVTDAEGRFELLCPWAEPAATLSWQPIGGTPQPLGQVAFGQDLELTVTKPR